MFVNFVIIEQVVLALSTANWELNRLVLRVAVCLRPVGFYTRLVFVTEVPEALQ